ncbi:MAG TPA: glycerate kinase [Anaerolineae bacterium]|nr:glycerate kinase [Anaerolineae bacterium]
MALSLSPVRALDLDLPVHAKECILAIMEAALLAVDPAEAVKRRLQLDGDSLRVGSIAYDLAELEHIYVVGAGKASAAMACALEDILGERITTGWINVKDGYTAPTRVITLHEASHPFPDTRGVEGSQRIASVLSEAGPRDLVFCLISGGGSALLVLPAEGIALKDIESLTQALLRSGATINQINAVRKHLSQVKGGYLSRLAHPAQVISLIVSDVIGNPLDVIASGPTTPDPTTFSDAYAVLLKYDLVSEVPVAITHHLQQGIEGLIPETPKVDDPIFARTQNVIVASNRVAARAALEKARGFGLNTLLLSTFVEGEAREVAKVFAAVAREIDHSGQPLARPACVVAGGETTVTVRGRGLGGRSQELALAAAPLVAGLDNMAIVALGTDGTDGPTDAAGALCTGCTAQRASQQGLSVAGYLADNDAYHFFHALGDLLITGPTNTNVNDLIFVLVF